ncbi:MAG: RsmB/NOP family class I SAM-dependent RNA methyltransferase [Parvibaculaceae bacterium]
MTENDTKVKDAGLAARQGAHRLIAAVLTQKRALDEAFAEEATRGGLAGLEPADRGFARAIATTTIRHIGELDLIIKRLLDKKLPPRAGITQTILRAALAELFFLDVKPHAVVDLAVEAATRDDDAMHFKSLVNAILRRALRERDTIRNGIDGERAALQPWLWKSWIGIYGEIKTREIIRAQFNEPPLDLSLKDNTAPDEWATKLNATLLPSGSLRLHQSGRIETLEGFAEGAWWVQDAAAALPVKLLGDVKGRDVLDLCAAPGGKTLSLAARGASVTALDRSAPRLERLKENLERLSLNAEIIVEDATKFGPERTWDFILLDAPCTATGTARRHPDVLLLKSAADRDRLTMLQARLLKKSAELLSLGGTLIYCTCSLEPEEGPAQIDAFLAAHPEFERVPVTADEVGGLSEAITKTGDLRTLPCHWSEAGGLDGFYAARLRRKSLTPT